MQPVSVQPDGLHLSLEATPAQLAADPTLRELAAGLLAAALASLPKAWANLPLADLVRHPGPEVNGLLAALLVLDAALITGTGRERRAVPLPGFLSYRHRLAPDNFSPHTLRLPPLNQDGHYMFNEIEDKDFLAVRFDRHPRLRVAGHVRIAAGGQSRAPQRLTAIEQRLDHQTLDTATINATLSAGNAGASAPLSAAALVRLAELLGQEEGQL